jgi:hypothetical protein
MHQPKGRGLRVYHLLCALISWLPAPNDTIYLVMRLYWPKAEPPSVLPPGEGTWKPPAIVASK